MKAKRTFSLALALTTLAGSTGVYAANFKDVPYNHWARPYINKGTNLGLVKGIDKNRFEPDASVTKVQAVVFVSRLLNAGNDERTKSLSKYNKILRDKKVPEWAKEDVSVALSRGIVEESILDNIFNRNGAETLISREEICIYLVRAMGLEGEAASQGGNVNLDFKDFDSIDRYMTPYVQVMADNSIMIGDRAGNFNPKMIITRAQMSKILVSVKEWLD